MNVLVELETTKHVCIISTRSCSVLSRTFFENVIKEDLAIVAKRKRYLHTLWQFIIYFHVSNLSFTYTYEVILTFV